MVLIRLQAIMECKPMLLASGAPCKMGKHLASTGLCYLLFLLHQLTMELFAELAS